MTGDSRSLDWAMMAVSLFNTILLLWLGLTVLLNAERRDLGHLAGGRRPAAGRGLLRQPHRHPGARHRATSARGWTSGGTSAGCRSSALPFAWYVVMLWYAGFWDDAGTAPAPPPAPVAGRERPAGGWRLVALLALRQPAADLLAQLVAPRPRRLRRLSAACRCWCWSTRSTCLLCIGLSLDALRRPAPSARVMGDLARRRARPWLVATSLVLLAVSLLVARRDAAGSC